MQLDNNVKAIAHKKEEPLYNGPRVQLAFLGTSAKSDCRAHTNRLHVVYSVSTTDYGTNLRAELM